jgi:hypothetical protein
VNQITSKIFQEASLESLTHKVDDFVNSMQVADIVAINYMMTMTMSFDLQAYDIHAPVARLYPTAVITYRPRVRPRTARRSPSFNTATP